MRGDGGGGGGGGGGVEGGEGEVVDHDVVGRGGFQRSGRVEEDGSPVIKRY